MENIQNFMISQTVYKAASILIPSIGLLFVIAGIALLILRKTKGSFKQSKPIRRMSVYLIVTGCIFLLAGLLIVICFLPYLRLAGVL